MIPLAFMLVDKLLPTLSSVITVVTYFTGDFDLRLTISHNDFSKARTLGCRSFRLAGNHSKNVSLCVCVCVVTGYTCEGECVADKARANASRGRFIFSAIIRV